ncbi:MAG TPA: ATP-binding protein [Chloroflexota bacterium]|nr:ATP-binding protein [Chloroflexota bacterium]
MPGPVRLGIQARLLLLVAWLVVLFAAASGAVLLGLREVGRTYDHLLAVDERLLLDATRLRLLAELEVSAARGGGRAAAEELRSVDRAQDALVDDIEAVAAAPEDRALIARIRAANDAYDRAVAEVAALLAAGRDADAAAQAGRAEPARREFVAACDALIEAKARARDAAREAARRHLELAGAALIGALLVGGVLSAAVAFALGGRIVRGVTTAAAAVRRIAGGDLATFVAPQPDPELGALAADLDALRSRLLAARDAEAAHRARLNLIGDLSRALLAAPRLDDAVRALAEGTGTALGAVAVEVTLADVRTGRPAQRAAIGLAPDRPPELVASIAPEAAVLAGELRLWIDRAPTPEEQDLVEALAAEAGLALRNAVLAETALHRAEELDGFVNVVAHDIRGPVSLAQRLVELVRQRNPILAASEAPLFARIGDATAFAEGLIDDLRELARLGQPPPERAAVLLAEAVEEIRAALAPLLADRGVALRPPVADLVVSADRRQLRQLLTNLVENAVKHMGRPHGEGLVRVEAAPVGDWCLIGVVDNGRGIAPEHRDVVFLPFRRLGGDEPGMGVGLAIARRIIEAHGGAIWIEDAPGGGCAVRFTLPLDGRVSPRPATSGGASARPVARTGQTKP